MRAGGAGLAKGWAVSGISDQTREAVTAAADAVGMPVGAWIERALRQALEAKAEPAAPEGVEIDELEAMVRRGGGGGGGAGEGGGAPPPGGGAPTPPAAGAPAGPP